MCSGRQGTPRTKSRVPAEAPAAGEQEPAWPESAEGSGPEAIPGPEGRSERPAAPTGGEEPVQVCERKSGLTGSSCTRALTAACRSQRGDGRGRRGCWGTQAPVLAQARAEGVVGGGRGRRGAAGGCV